MKIKLEQEEIRIAIENFVKSKLVGNPEIIIGSTGEEEFEVEIIEKSNN
jgi:hypothetical protein